MVGVVHIPNGLGSLRLIWNGDTFGVKHRRAILMFPGWRFHGRCQQHGAKDATAASRPPFAHLVNGLARIALQPGKSIDGNNGKVHFQAGFGALGIGEIGDYNLDRLAEIGRSHLLFEDVLGRISVKMQCRLMFNVNAGKIGLVKSKFRALHRDLAFTALEVQCRGQPPQVVIGHRGTGLGIRLGLTIFSAQ